MRFVLAPLRAALFVLHVLAGLATVLLVFPLAGLATRNRINRAWSRILVAVCGARLVVDGTPIEETVITKFKVNPAFKADTFKKR